MRLTHRALEFELMLFFQAHFQYHLGIFLCKVAGYTLTVYTDPGGNRIKRNGIGRDEGYLSKRQVLRPILTDTALPAFRWLPWIVIFVPPETGPRDGITRPKYGD